METIRLRSFPAQREIGHESPTFVIAEVGVNHNGRRDLAIQSVDVAAAAGADAVKFQTFRTEKLVTKSAPRARYQEQNTGTQQSQFDMLKALELTDADHEAVLTRCREKNTIFMSTPFDEESADFLESLGMPFFKVPSGELTNLPLLKHIAQFRKPMIVSTGMSTLGDVETAVRTIEDAGNPQIILLHCVSNYPAAPSEINLRAMLSMKAAFGLPVGYSDHSLGTEIAFAAVALGACVVEKHFTLDRRLPGPDHAASSEPPELRSLIDGIRKIESAMGNGRKKPSEDEKNTAQVARKSLVAARDIPAGTELTEDLIAIRRPGTGLAPAMKPHLINRTMRISVSAGDLIRLEDVA